MKIILILFVSIFLLILLDKIIARMYQNTKHPHHTTPGKYGIPFEEVHFPVGKNGQLYGWWIPTSRTAPTLILVHGWGRNLSRMLPYIRNFHSLGYNLLAFDARNHGSSTSQKTPTVWTFTQDTCAAVNFIAESPLVSSQEIGVVGLSIGGGAVINAASWEDRIRSVITVGAFSHPVEVMKLGFQEKHIPYIPFGWLFFKYMRFRFRLNFNKIAPINNIHNTRADILLIHGDQDLTVPLAQGRSLLEAGNPETTHLWAVPGKGHSDCHTHPRFWEKIESFLQETLPLIIST